MKIKLILLLALGLIGCNTTMQFSRPYQNELHTKIVSADRIVVRDGGQTCCATPVEMLSQPIYFTTTNQVEISNVIAHLNFEPILRYNPCGCCGHPGIDWFKGEKRLAITTWKHGYGVLMEDGFVGELVPESKAWLRAWLLAHGLKEEEIK